MLQQSQSSRRRFCIDATQGALQAARGEIGAARAERIGIQEAMDATKAVVARKSAEIKELRYEHAQLHSCCPLHQFSDENVAGLSALAEAFGYIQCAP